MFVGRAGPVLIDAMSAASTKSNIFSEEVGRDKGRGRANCLLRRDFYLAAVVEKGTEAR